MIILDIWLGTILFFWAIILLDSPKYPTLATMDRITKYIHIRIIATYIILKHLFGELILLIGDLLMRLGDKMVDLGDRMRNDRRLYLKEINSVRYEY